MGVIDVSPAIVRFSDKIKSLIPPCEDPEKEIRHAVKLGVKRPFKINSPYKGVPTSRR